MIGLLTAFIVANILLHELFHKAAYTIFGIKSVFIRKEAKIFGKQVPIGIELHPKHYDYSVRQHLLVAASGFAGSMLVSVIFFQLTDNFSLHAGIVVFPFIISIFDFRAILEFISKDWNTSVAKAHLTR